MRWPGRNRVTARPPSRTRQPAMSIVLDDPDHNAERLLEASRAVRTRRVATRELLAEASAGALFLACAGTLAVLAGQLDATPPALAALLVALLAIVSRVKFPIGVGFVVPTPLVLVPMLLLLPPATVP